MQTFVAVGIGIGMKLADQGDIQAGFLFGLAHGGLFQAFTDINEAAGQRPAAPERFDTPLDQQDSRGDRRGPAGESIEEVAGGAGGSLSLNQSWLEGKVAGLSAALDLGVGTTETESIRNEAEALLKDLQA